MTAAETAKFYRDQAKAAMFDEVVAALRDLLKANERYAKAIASARVAEENFTDPRPELNAVGRALSALANAKIDACAVLAKAEALK